MADENRMQQMSAEFQKMVDDFFAVQCRYSAAMREVQTKLEILDDEFQMKHRRNPIHHMQARLKTIQSMMEKLRRKDYAVSMQSAVENLKDIAGIRVICSYVQDVYTVARLLTSQDDIRLLEMRDYIRNPKPNGYRSLHLIVEIPVFLQEGRIMVPVEIQVRTIAMDFWASLEHDLRYKAQGIVPQNICDELQQVGEDIAVLDRKMQSIHDRIDAVLAHESLDAEGFIN
ncbi:MAG: GTP pyrophosphokinase family protein [Clostridia bacterium]|nr:GTP pyrophosphokinase family protein [Clostridia bacterium]